MKKMNILATLALITLALAGSVEAGFRDSISNLANKTGAAARSAASSVKSGVKSAANYIAPKIKSGYGYTRRAVKRAMASKTVEQLKAEAIKLVKEQSKKALDAGSAYALTQATGLLEKAGDKAVKSVNSQLTKAGLPSIEKAASEAAPLASELPEDDGSFGGDIESLIN